jgi:hypothetical protein
MCAHPRLLFRAVVHFLAVRRDHGEALHPCTGAIMTEPVVNWGEFLLLWAAGVFGVVAVIPYSLTLQKSRLQELRMPLQVVIPAQVFQNAILIAMAVGLGLVLAKHTGLGTPLIARWLAGEQVIQDLQAIIAPALLLGVGVSLVILILEVAVFAPRVPESLRSSPQAPVWQRILAAFYGGITEELLTHLGLLTLLAWLLGRLSHTPEGLPSSVAMWTAVVLTAVLFGLGHLPTTAALAPLTPMVIIRAVALNGVAGITFGYLYWAFGLVAAMLAHFTTDIVLHVVAPLLNSTRALAKRRLQ